ncbi:MAG: FAD-dependent oxidoreductase, partial [Alphaproteobacteria bacterium HGW-Alphaproteobacteria-8]
QPGAVRVTVVERRDTLGRGVAYSTRDASHLLNTRVANMSAFPDDPEHFWRWLNTTGEVSSRGCRTPFCFVRREIYGRYLSELLTPWRAIGGDGRFRSVSAECLRIDPAATGVGATLDNGAVVVAQAAVLATGHALPEDKTAALSDPWAGGLPDPDAPVLIVGAGLTMVDKTLSLLDAGHRGPITALSRRGLLPQPHADSKALRLDSADLPIGAGVVWAMRWLRRLAGDVAARGGDWRDVVDGVRPHLQAVWAGFSDDAKRRFLRHARVWWEVHRHRMPPDSAALIQAAQASGQLVVARGRFLDAHRTADGVSVRVAPPEGGARRLDVGAAYDCRGILRDPETCATPLMRSLLDAGQARIDALRLGLDVDQTCRLRTRSGAPAERLYAIGPVTRPAFWEITAIPDIRVQARALAERIGADLSRRTADARQARGAGA